MDIDLDRLLIIRLDAPSLEYRYLEIIECMLQVVYSHVCLDDVSFLQPFVYELINNRVIKMKPLTDDQIKAGINTLQRLWSYLNDSPLSEELSIQWVTEIFNSMVKDHLTDDEIIDIVWNLLDEEGAEFYKIEIKPTFDSENNPAIDVIIYMPRTYLNKFIGEKSVKTTLKLIEVLHDKGDGRHPFIYFRTRNE